MMATPEIINGYNVQVRLFAIFLPAQSANIFFHDSYVISRLITTTVATLDVYKLVLDNQSEHHVCTGSAHTQSK